MKCEDCIRGIYVYRTEFDYEMFQRNKKILTSLRRLNFGSFSYHLINQARVVVRGPEQ